MDSSDYKAVFLDTETAGLRDDSPIIELAAVAVNRFSFEELEVFEAKIHFDITKADPEALRVNGYDSEKWADALSPNLAWRQFAVFLDRHRTVPQVAKSGRPWLAVRSGGHNIAGFDLPRIRKAMSDRQIFCSLGYTCVLDTMQEAEWFFSRAGDRIPPESRRLTSLCEYFGISAIDAHTALADTRMSIALAKRFLGVA